VVFDLLAGKAEQQFLLKPLPFPGEISGLLGRGGAGFQTEKK